MTAREKLKRAIETSLLESFRVLQTVDWRTLEQGLEEVTMAVESHLNLPGSPIAEAAAKIAPCFKDRDAGEEFEEHA